MKIDGVFSGGGVKAYAFVGVLQSMHEKQLQLERVAGTSAGAIVASLIAAGYRLEAIERLLAELDLKKLLDPPKITTYLPFTKWLFLFFQMGLNKGNRLEKWLYEQLAKQNVFTFKDFKKDYLKVVVSDLSLGKLVVLPDDLERIYGIDPNEFSVAKAVRMSCSFPFFFMPEKLISKNKQKSIIVDGGVLSNFPMWVFDNESSRGKRPLLGVTLSDSYDKLGNAQPINNALEMINGLFSTMKKAHDARYISKHDSNDIIYIPVTDVNTVDFMLDEQTKQQLVSIGRQYADAFLKHWPT